jgi:oligoendopeptidase F
MESLAEKNRAEVDAHFKWRIEDLYPSDAAWRDAYETLAARQDALEGYRGKLGQGPALLACLTTRDQLDEALSKLYVYAHMRLHEDSGVSDAQAMADLSESLAARFAAAAAFIEPEILALPPGVLARCQQEPGLALYGHSLEDLLRQKDHVLSPDLEELLAKAAEIAGAPENVFSMLNNADMEFGEIMDHTNTPVRLTHGRYVSLMESPDPRVRRDTFHTLYGEYTRRKNTLAALYNASVKKDIFFSRAHKYGTALEAALAGSAVPVSVYTRLIDTVAEFLPDLGRYLGLRKKALGLEEVHMYDIYAPLVAEADIRVPYPEAQATVLAALAPLGQAYVDTVAQGFKTWVDVYENKGKRSGAYAWGAYGCHPYVLLNYNNKLHDMFTLAHEMGHALHSFSSWGHQPYLYSGHTIFTAEVASTVNEVLLTEYLLRHTDQPLRRKYLVNHYAEQFRGTVFRQTMFAEFELRTHTMVEQDQPLTVDALCSLYGDLNRRYYPGVAQDPEILYEWARIPHFYSPFYVYQYATGFSAAVALAQRILTEGPPAVADYHRFLQCGTSQYSIDQLKAAGVDMSAPQPVRQALGVFKRLVDELEA